MSGLVDYGSSDEEEVWPVGDSALGTLTTELDANESFVSQTPGIPLKSNADSPSHGSSATQSHASNGSLVGPLGPPMAVESAEDVESTPQSPYSVYQTSVRNLTLPPIPNMDIPSSPPGSPPPEMGKKFEHFLVLKRQGIHFNEKLSKSSALKNPSLLQKLMASAGVDEHDQYKTTLSKNAWNPTAFPSWAFEEELAKSQQELKKKKEEEKALKQRGSIEFVSANNSVGLTKCGSPGPAVMVKEPKGSMAERIMAGLDRERTGSPQNFTMRNGSDRRGGWNAGPQQGTGLRSPKRQKRSTSR